jgi:hypothetical protein
MKTWLYNSLRLIGVLLIFGLVVVFHLTPTAVHVAPTLDPSWKDTALTYKLG